MISCCLTAASQPDTGLPENRFLFPARYANIHLAKANSFSVSAHFWRRRTPPLRCYRKQRQRSKKKKIPRRITPHKTITRREIGYTPRCRSLLAARTQCVFDLQPAGASARIQHIHALEESPHKGEKNDDVPPGSPGRGRKRSEVVGTRGCQ